MFLRFSVTNYKSFRARQELTLVASNLEGSTDQLKEVSGVPSGVLTSAIVYGANASGKSNVILAILAMRDIVLNSHSQGEPGGNIPPYSPFRLDKASLAAPAVFEADFVIDRVRYHYGFEFDDKNIFAEWLHSYASNRRTELFDRKSQVFKFGRSLRGRNQVISDLTRTNSLLVSAAAQNGHEELTKIYDYFKEIIADRDFSVSGATISRLLNKDSLDQRAIDFIGRLGTGIYSYHKRKPPEVKSEFFDDFVRLMSKHFEGIDGDEVANIAKEVSIIELEHRNTSGDPVYFSLDEESDGTRRLVMLLSRIFRALDSGSLLLIDELDASLHTQACEALVALFSNPTMNHSGAQLIATTHDTNLLRSPVIRRDQIWFTEKDRDGSSCLYPLTDFRTRSSDNFEKGYLQGRYGALPFAGPASELFGG